MAALKKTPTPTLNVEPKKGEELIKKTDIPNTPFTVITFPDKNEHFGCLGKYRLTEVHNNFKDCEDDIKSMTWNRIVQVTSLVNQILKENK